MKSADYPALYNDADAASLREQRKFYLALSANLLLLVFIATLSVIGHPATWYAAAQVAALLITIALSLYLALSQPQRNWYGTRALAESIKTVAWRFVTRAEPYDGDDSIAREHFVANVKKIMEDNGLSTQLVTYSGGDQITKAMNTSRKLSLADRKNKYNTERVGEQLNWYRKKTRDNVSLSKRWFLGLISIQVLALACAMGRFWHPEFPYWPTDVFIACASGAMAWLQTKRFQELAASYSLTAHDIGLLRVKLTDVTNEKAFSAFVGDAENAFSREHTQWRARRDTN